MRITVWKLALIGLIAVATAGCSAHRCYWYNPARTLEQARQDCLECYDDALAQASEAMSEYYSNRYTTAAPEHFGEDALGMSDADRMAIQGWNSWGAAYQDRIFRGCMRQRGYCRKKADKLDPSARKRILSIGNVAGR
ncbi:MAG: hypothetical protein ABIF19_17570 [Planctomycetota bacterium]